MQNSRKAGGEAGQREFWIRTLSSCARPYGSHSLLSISDSQSVRFPEIPREPVGRWAVLEGFTSVMATFRQSTWQRCDKTRGNPASLNVFFQSLFFDAPRSKEKLRASYYSNASRTDCYRQEQGSICVPDKQDHGHYGHQTSGNKLKAVPPRSAKFHACPL